MTPDELYRHVFGQTDRCEARILRMRLGACERTETVTGGNPVRCVQVDGDDESEEEEDVGMGDIDVEAGPAFVEV
jgi:hypothetical protein